jgi:pyrimidine-specific ribonucleoside hydrolase
MSKLFPGDASEMRKKVHPFRPVIIDTELPDSSFSKVKSLLSAFHHEGIQVGIGDKTGQELPDWSSFAQGIPWGNLKEKRAMGVREGAKLVLDRTTEHYRDKITLIALGSLKTFADWMKPD